MISHCAPGASVAIVGNVIICPATVGVPIVGFDVALTNVIHAGSSSLITTLFARPVPIFLYKSLYVTISFD